MMKVPLKIWLFASCMGTFTGTLDSSEAEESRTDESVRAAARTVIRDLSSRTGERLAIEGQLADWQLVVVGQQHTTPSELKDGVASVLRAHWQRGLTSALTLKMDRDAHDQLQGYLEAFRKLERRKAEDYWKSAAADLNSYVKEEHLEQARRVLADPLQPPYSDKTAIVASMRAAGRLALRDLGSEGRQALASSVSQLEVPWVVSGSGTTMGSGGGIATVASIPFADLSAETAAALRSVFKALLEIQIESLRKRLEEGMLSPEAVTGAEEFIRESTEALAVMRSGGTTAAIFVSDGSQVWLDLLYAPGRQAHFILPVRDLSYGPDLEQPRPDEETERQLAERIDRQAWWWAGRQAALEAKSDSQIVPGVAEWDGPDPLVSIECQSADLPKALAALSVSGRMAVVSEEFPTPRMLSLNRQGVSLREVADQIAKTFGLTLSRSGNVVTAQFVDWTERASRSVPISDLIRWAEGKKTSKSHNLSFEALLEIAKLSLPQLLTASEFVHDGVALAPEVERISSRLLLFRLLAGLSLSQRTALLRGEAVRFSELNTGNRNTLLAWLQSLGFGILYPLGNPFVVLGICDDCEDSARLVNSIILHFHEGGLAQSISESL